MTQSRTPGDSVHIIFRILAVAASFAAFFQVTLGGVVRVTGSGLGCPDWPLCHGQLIPPFEFTTLLEYSHRLSASVLSLFVIALAVLAWVYYRNNRWIVIPVFLGLGMVFIAALLGGATVLTELAWWLRLIHLGVAEVVVACMIIAVVAGFRLSGNYFGNGPTEKVDSGFNRLMYLSLAGVFILILSGSYIVGYGAGSSCATWPLCRGSLFPEGAAFAVHMGHRYIAAIIGVLVIITAVVAWQRRNSLSGLGWSGVLLGVAFVAQILVGAMTVWAGFSAEMKAAHLSMATLVWMALVLVAAIIYAPRKFEAAMPEASFQQASNLEGLA